MSGRSAVGTLDPCRVPARAPHTARECGVVFASFKGFESPLRHRARRRLVRASATHRIWWEVEAATADEALARLPRYVAARTTAIRVGELQTP